MRIIYKNCIIVIDLAVRDGARLIFRTCDNLHYHTNDYGNESLANLALDSLYAYGHLRVGKLHKFVGHIDLDYYIKHNA